MIKKIQASLKLFGIEYTPLVAHTLSVQQINGIMLHSRRVNGVWWELNGLQTGLVPRGDDRAMWSI